MPIFRGKGEPSPKKASDSKDAKRASGREVGQDETLPAGQGDKTNGKRGRPGSTKYGGTLDPNAPYDDLPGDVK